MLSHKKQCDKLLSNSCTTLRPAFTLIEVLIAVTMLSLSFLYVLKIHSERGKHVIFLSERNKHSLEDSLYLTTNILRYHKDKKSAYDILERHLKVKKDESRTILKKSKRQIFIPEEIKI